MKKNFIALSRDNEVISFRGPSEAAVAEEALDEGFGNAPFSVYVLVADYIPKKKNPTMFHTRVPAK